ncbi:hypothetical protein AVEN_34441-1 [Araneus ventricosus]|uniref:Uncharacterized protein n=1 Tax=Araneus ventricosus TaxID=182803 RepID=A0A4Y2GXV5_ARAVE|nr:hypothetical protein AVEN_34441-1 [Araneus ventricosus]
MKLTLWPAIGQPRSDWVKCEQFLRVLAIHDLVGDVGFPWLEKSNSNRAFAVLRFWRLGVNLATHRGIQIGWLVRGGESFFWLMVGGGKGKKQGEEDLPDERVPVDKKENVMRNEKESGSKCF